MKGLGHCTCSIVGCSTDAGEFPWGGAFSRTSQGQITFPLVGLWMVTRLNIVSARAFPASLEQNLSSFGKCLLHLRLNFATLPVAKIELSFVWKNPSTITRPSYITPAWYVIFHIRRITNGFSKEFATVVVCRQPLEKKLHRLLNTNVGVWYRRWAILRTFHDWRYLLWVL